MTHNDHIEADVQNVLLRLLAKSLFGKDIEANSQLSGSGFGDAVLLNAVFKESRSQACTVVACAALPAGTAGKDKWDDLSYRIIARNMNVLNAHEEVQRLMSEASVPCVFLKGWASSSYYPDPMARQLGDVDFLVADEYFAAADQALIDGGYEPKKHSREGNHHYEYKKDGISVELHYAINGVPEGEKGDSLREYLSDIIETAVPSRDGLMLPDDFHHGIVILLHNAHHMMNTGMGLRHLADWAVFVNKTGGNFREMFEIPFKETGIWEFARIMTALCTRYLGLPKQEWAGEYDGEFLKEMIEDIYGHGNFGHKKSGSDVSNLLLQNTNEKIAHVGLFGRLFASMNYITRIHWPAARRLPLLYPVGWVYFSLRYLLRVALGKRVMINITDTVGSAHQRNQLYEKLKLFET